MYICLVPWTIIIIIITYIKVPLAHTNLVTHLFVPF